MPEWMGKNPQRLNPTQNYRQVRNIENGRESLPQLGAHQLVVIYQMVRPEDMHTSGMVQTEHAIFMNSNYINYC